ncbi:MAG: SulP family inorganic anion transporter [Candidatus Latescibacterota bacterium]|jgi:SulP family sulfate permease
MDRLFPFLRWLPELRNGQVLRADLVAGVTVAMVLIPQAMAYAELAGLPAVYGLYAAFLPPAVAALFGSSRQLATGPVAMASLISAATVQSAVPMGSSLYIEYALLLALMVGAIRLLLGLLRLGVLVNLLSAPVVVGFTNAAALIIATSQLHKVFGVESPQAGTHIEAVWGILERGIESPHYETLAMSLLAGLLLIGLRWRLPRWPHVLIAAATTSVVAWMSGYSGRLVGEIPVGLPSLVIPDFQVDAIGHLLPGAVTLTLIGLMEAMAIAKTIATHTKQRINIDQELVGQGMANLVGGFFQSYAVSGSFSRSSINFASGARTGFSSLVTSVVVGITLLWFTPLLYFLPQATLAMIIIVAVAKLVRFTPLLNSWRISRHDGLVGIVTFAVTLVAAPALHWGVVLGVSMSVVLNFYRTMHPHAAFLTRHLDGTLREGGAAGLAADQKIAIMRFDGRLYFGSSSYFEDLVLESIARAPELRYLVVDAQGINQIDASGEQTLRAVIERLREVGIDVYFTRAKGQFTDVLERSGAMEYIGRDHFFRWNQHALEYLWARLEPGYKAHCPLNMPHPQQDKKASNEYYI